MQTNERAKTTLWLSGIVGGMVAGVVSMGGCSKPPPPPPPPPPAHHDAPPPPEPVDTEALLQQLQADARVQFPNTAAPTSEELARAIIALADAFAKGDAAKLRPMLDQTGQTVLDELQSSGAWDEATHKIEAVRITKLDATDEPMPSADVVTAIQEPAAAYQLRWHATPNGSTYLFSPTESDGKVVARVGDFDGTSAAPPAPAAPDSTDAPPAKTPGAQPPKPSGGGGGGGTENGAG